jgi:hypothetical protein
VEARMNMGELPEVLLFAVGALLFNATLFLRPAWQTPRQLAVVIDFNEARARRLRKL